MQLNVGNGYGRSAVPGFVIHKCWAQWYAATNSPNITGKSQVSPRNGHNRPLHWRIISFRCYDLLQHKNPPFPEKRGISLIQKFRQTGFAPQPDPTYHGAIPTALRTGFLSAMPPNKTASLHRSPTPRTMWDYCRSTNSFSAVNHRWTRPEPSPPASFSTSATVTWL